MSETPKPEQLIPPQATPDTLHDVVVDIWQNNLDALRDDQLPYGNGQTLRLYPTDSPRDSILIFPKRDVAGHSSMEDGTFRIVRTKGSKATDILDITTNDDGKRWAVSLGNDSPYVLELLPTEEGSLDRMQKAISEASPVRPLGRIAKALGRTTSKRR